MTIDKRLVELEKLLLGDKTPGTTIPRVFKEDGYQWCLAVGAMQMPKTFFYGESIEDCIDSAMELLKLNH